MIVSTAALRIGTRIQRDGRLWTVGELHANRVQLRSGSAVVVTSIDELVNDPNAGFVDCQPLEGKDIGATIDDLTKVQRQQWLEVVGHVCEVLTGFRSGEASNARSGEPRSCYRPDVAMKTRYQAKAEEIGKSAKTIARWVQDYRREGSGALVDHRCTRTNGVLDSCDRRWVEMCSAVCAELVSESTHSKSYVLRILQARLTDEYGPGVVEFPKKTAAYRALDEVTEGTNMFRGSAKGRREIDTRPEGMYGQLRATRLGEYVILDTTRLDVYAMEKVTYRWVNTELTVAMDLYGRIVCGLRLAPISTRSIDVASVLYEVICPRSELDPKVLPYIGFPETLLLPTSSEPGPHGGASIPIECVVIDHGRVYMSQHVRSALERFGISVQPVRLYHGSDKGPLERWFRTLREGLLEHLDGYKGPDVYSRGADAEAGAFYFVDELEQIIRNWIRTVYHRRPHRGLVLPAAPRLELSPDEMYEIGISTTGFRRIPTSPDAVYDLLPISWRKIHHYGIDFQKLIYNDAVLVDFTDTTSPFRGSHPGKYPIRYDPNDISAIYFQHPDHRTWHRIQWVHGDAIRAPFSLDALEIARKFAARRYPDRFPDDKLALTELLERWSRATISD
ncbi:MAG: Mu transposase C-terminal domain-containing protein, partial [Rhodococcus qingshengii]